MKRLFCLSSVLFSLLFFQSCSESNEGPAPTPEDTSYYYALARWGEIYKIGNATGDAEEVDKLEGLNNSLINNTITSFFYNTYAIEYFYNPTPVNRLFIYNLNSEEQSYTDLTLPPEIVGDEPSFVSLDWSQDKKKLIGIIKSNILSETSINYLVEIDTSDYKVDYTGLSFHQFASRSSVVDASKLYSVGDPDILEIDLNTLAIDTLSVEPDMKIRAINKAITQNDNLVGFTPSDVTSGFVLSGIVPNNPVTTQDIASSLENNELVLSEFGKGYGQSNGLGSLYAKVVWNFTKSEYQLYMLVRGQVMGPETYGAEYIIPLSDEIQSTEVFIIGSK